jgi:hypothetical protein
MKLSKRRYTNWLPGDKVRTKYGVVNPLTLQSLPANTEVELLNLERVQDSVEVWLVSAAGRLWGIGHVNLTMLRPQNDEPSKVTEAAVIAAVVAKHEATNLMAAAFVFLAAAYVLGLVSRVFRP